MRPILTQSTLNVEFIDVRIAMGKVVEANTILSSTKHKLQRGEISGRHGNQ